MGKKRRTAETPEEYERRMLEDQEDRDHQRATESISRGELLAALSQAILDAKADVYTKPVDVLISLRDALR